MVLRSLSRMNLKSAVALIVACSLGCLWSEKGNVSPKGSLLNTTVQGVAKKKEDAKGLITLETIEQGRAEQVDEISVDKLCKLILLVTYGTD